jgi:hypothetical protein
MASQHLAVSCQGRREPAAVRMRRLMRNALLRSSEMWKVRLAPPAHGSLRLDKTFTTTSRLGVGTRPCGNVAAMEPRRAMARLVRIGTIREMTHATSP